MPDRPKRVWCQDDGHYNHLPTPNEPVPIGEFWYWLFQASFTVEVRQVEKFRYNKVLIFWAENSAYALIQPDKWKSSPKLHYPNMPTALRIGCRHEYHVERQPLPCYKEVKCAKCGHEKVIDSSD